MSTPHSDHAQAYFDNLNVNQGLTDEVMRDLGYDTKDTIADSLERSDPVPHVNSVGLAGREATGHAARLEVVDENHAAEPDAPREATLRERPKATTVKAKFHRDMGESAKRKPDPAHRPYPPIRRVS